MRKRFIACALLTLIFAPTRAQAQEVDLDSDHDRVAPPPADRPAPPVRSWAYVEDPSLPAAGGVVAWTRGTYAGASDVGSATRAFAGNAARAGGMLEAGAEVGLLSVLALQASGVGTFGRYDGVGAGATAGLRLSPLPAASPFKVALGAGWLREPGEIGGQGAWARMDASYETGRLRLATNAHGEHLFVTGRDALDVLVTTGATVRLAGPLRAGVEYVAQDLEGAFDYAEAEGGVRPFVGPTVVLDRLGDHLTVAASPGVGLSYATPHAVGRLALAYAF